MMCPEPVGKSGKNWLDRLRSSKGFPPPGSGLDLDQFLLLPDPNPSHPSPPAVSAAAAAAVSPLRHPGFPEPDGEKRLPRRPRRRGEEPGDAKEEGRKWFEIVGGALAELFHMGDPSELCDLQARRGGPKNPRKQPNPRIFVISAAASNASSDPAGEEGDCDGRLPAAPPAGVENGIAGTKTRRRRAPAPSGAAADSSDLAAYSRTDVTVIDTSSPSWKSQKIIFRKGSVWRVRDKKSWSVSRKKRRLGVVKRSASEKEQEEPPATGGREVLAKDHTPSPSDVSSPVPTFFCINLKNLWLYYCRRLSGSSGSFRGLSSIFLSIFGIKPHGSLFFLITFPLDDRIDALKVKRTENYRHRVRFSDCG